MDPLDTTAPAPDTGLEFPRITDVLARLQQPHAPARVMPTEDGPLPPAMARLVVEEAVQPATHAIADLLPPMPAPELLPPMPPDCPLPAVPDDRARQLVDEEIDGLPLRDVAREALRARMVAFGEGRHTRSVYETVFVMLAFSVMVLLTAPPLVDVLLAAHGVKH